MHGVWGFQVEVSSTWHQEQYTLDGTLLGLDVFDWISWKLHSSGFMIEGGGDFLCCNLPSSGFHLPNIIWIGLGFLCILSSGGVSPLSSAFLGRWCYSPHLQRQSCLSGGGGLAVATSFLVKSASSLPFLERWRTLHLILLQKQRTWRIWQFLQVLVPDLSIGAWHCF